MPTMCEVTEQSLTGVVYGFRPQGGMSQQDISGAFDNTPPSNFDVGSP